MAHTAPHSPKKDAKRASQTKKAPPVHQKEQKHHAPVTHEYLPGDGLDRESMIAEAAYYRAERRNFDGGDPVADWLEAEAEIDAILSGQEETSVH